MIRPRIAVLVCAVVLASCGTPPRKDVEPPPEPAPVVPAPVPPRGITVAAVGDIMMGTDYPENTLPDDDGVSFLSGVAPVLSAADITFGNLEGVLMDGGEAVKRCKPPPKRKGDAVKAPRPAATSREPQAPNAVPAPAPAQANTASKAEGAVGTIAPAAPGGTPGTASKFAPAQTGTVDEANKTVSTERDAGSASPPQSPQASAPESVQQRPDAPVAGSDANAPAGSQANAQSSASDASGPAAQSPTTAPQTTQPPAQATGPAEAPAPAQAAAPAQATAPAQAPAPAPQPAPASAAAPNVASTDPTAPAVQQPATSGSCYVFRSPTRYATYLRDAGFDVMSLANNHAQDFGDPGRDSSMRALDAVGIRHSGRDGDVAQWETNGRRFAMVAFAPNVGSHQLNDHARARQIVGDLASRHDIVIVSFHGGSEGEGASKLPFAREMYQGEDRGDVVEFAHAMVDAGADLVLGHGPHVLRPLELYQERLVAYSLGNFATYYGISVAGIRGISGILTARLADDGRFLDGRFDATVQVRPAGPTLDPERRALTQLRGLAAEAFPSSLLTIEDDGRIVRTTP